MVADLISFLTSEATLLVLIAYVAALWAALVIWTVFDIKSRTNNIFYLVGSIILVLTAGLIGFAIYLMLRPSLTKEEISIREYEEKVLETTAHVNVCQDCGEVSSEKYKFCPNCGVGIKKQCTSCQKQLKIAWRACPYCGEKQPGAKEEKVESVIGASAKGPNPLLRIVVRLTRAVRDEIGRRRAKAVMTNEKESGRKTRQVKKRVKKEKT